MTLFDDWIRKLSLNLENSHLSLRDGWNIFVLARLKNNNHLKEAMVKAVHIGDCDEDEKELVEYTIPIGNQSIRIFDPFGVGKLKRENGFYKSCLGDRLNILNDNMKFIQGYGWKRHIISWDLVGSFPLVPPMEIGGIGVKDVYLSPYYISALKFPNGFMETVLIASMRLGVVIGEPREVEKVTVNDRWLVKWKVEGNRYLNFYWRVGKWKLSIDYREEIALHKVLSNNNMYIYIRGDDK